MNFLLLFLIIVRYLHIISCADPSFTPSEIPTEMPTILINITLQVNSIIDSNSNISSCYPTTYNNSCNLRSAWEVCNSIENEYCIIELPLNEIIFLTLGDLILNPNTNSIEIIGNDCIITSGVVPDTTFDEITIPGFPVYDLQLTNTNSATQNYFTGVVFACPNDVFTFSSCEYEDTTEDTYYRLFNSNGNQIAFNDDTCNFSSEIEYEVSSDSLCQNYSIHVGCYGTDTCTTTVTGILITNIVSYSSHRFIEYNNNNNNLIPSLIISNCLIQDFGDSNMNGGAISLIGTINFELNNVEFNTNEGVNGGSLYLSNMYNPIINNCTFDNNAAIENGGAIYVDTSVSNLKIINSEFIDCSSIINGGSVSFNNLNSNILILNTKFISSRAGNMGGSVFFLKNSDNIRMINNTFISSSCYAYGGSVAVYNSITNMHIINNTFQYSTSNTGMGIYFNANNNNINIIDSSFLNNRGTYGAGVALNEMNSYVTINNCIFKDNVVSSRSGGIYLFQNNTFNMISNCTFNNNQANYGGAIYMYSDNVNNVIIHNNFMLNYAQTNGGGILLGTRNTDNSIIDCTFADQRAKYGAGVYITTYSHNTVVLSSVFTRCIVTDYFGGAIFVRNSNYNLTIEATNVSYCNANFGGGVYFGANNSFLMNEVDINNCVSLYDGGGLYILSDMAEVIITNTKLKYNLARRNGGGIYVGSNNNQMIIAGCEINHNSAQYGGGLSLTSNNLNFAILDYDSYMYYQVIQSEHPYESFCPSAIGLNGPYVIISGTVKVDESIGFILIFNELTKTGPQDTMTIYDNDLNRNILYQFSVTTFPGINLPSITVSASSFYYEFSGPAVCVYTEPTKANNIYGIEMYVYPIYSNPEKKTMITNNYANNNGGGIYGYDYNLFFITINAIISNNHANNGGGVYFVNSNAGLTFEHVLIQNNTANDGGGLYLFTSNYGITFSESYIEYNTAKRFGGGVALITGNGFGIFDEGNEFTMNNCQINNNNALNGGGIYEGSNNAIEISFIILTNNSATNNGGAIFLDSVNMANINDCKITFNSAVFCGGGISSIYENVINFFSTKISNNEANVCGGGISIKSKTMMNFDGSNTLSYNLAKVVGGAIASFTCPLWSLTTGNSLIITNNNASLGSAIFFQSVLVSSSDYLHDIYFTDNNAFVGGTVYWLYDETMSLPPNGLSSSSIVWSKNLAKYGNKTATQALTIVGPDQYDVKVYAQSLWPSLIYSLRDYYHQFIPITGITSFYVSIKSIPQTSYQCGEFIPNLSGNDVIGENGVIMSNGYASFNELDVFCVPKGSLTLNIEAQLGHASAVSSLIPSASRFYISTQTKLNFRDCLDGEFQKNGQCIVCSDGTFSIKYEDESTECKECLTIEGVLSCYGNIIVLEPGYWRRYNYTEAIMECPLSDTSCIGGNSTGEMLCAEGYAGPQCATCAENYIIIEGSCEICKPKDLFSDQFILILSIIGFLTIVAIALYYIMKNRQTDGDISTLELAQLWCQQRFGLIAIKLKIGISTFQVITATPNVIDVKMPAQFSKFLDSFKFINFDMIGVFPVGCLVSFTFIDHMVMNTLLPIGISFALLFTFLIVSYSKRNNKKEYNACKDTYFNYFFYLTYLVLPSVTTTIFQIFICTNINPLDEPDYNNEPDHYLTADMNLACNSSYYYGGVYYAYIMILIYPVGIPLFYMISLYNNRIEIINRNNLDIDTNVVIVQDEVKNNPLQQDEKIDRSSINEKKDLNNGDHEEKILSDSANRLKFLWEAYRPKYWYWEIVETYRKLALTAILSVIKAGTSDQNIVAIGLALLFIKLAVDKKPYIAKSDNVLGETGHFQIFFTFLIALCITNKLLDKKYDNFLSFLLVFINLGVVYMSVYYEVKAGLAEKLAFENSVNDKSNAIVDDKDLFKAAVIKRKKYLDGLVKHVATENDLNDQIQAHFTNAIIPTNLASQWGSKESNERIRESSIIGIELNPYKRESESLEEGRRLSQFDKRSSVFDRPSINSRPSSIKFTNREYIDSDDEYE